MNKLSQPAVPIGLAKTQIQSFWETGYLVIDDVFTDSDIALLRAACESSSLVDDLKKRDFESRTVHLLEITTRHPLFLELARSPRMIERMVPLIGSDIQLQHSKLATKPPAKGKGPVKWHQDFAYFPHTNTDLVAVMVMLDDATPENGCMQVVRGSHKMGLLNHTEADGSLPWAVPGVAPVGGCRPS